MIKSIKKLIFKHDLKKDQSKTVLIFKIRDLSHETEITSFHRRKT
jgi:hypothetical protein